MLSVRRAAVLISACSLLACTNDPATPTAQPTKWSDIQDIPADFADGKDNVRTDDEIRAAVVESDPVYAASPASAITAEDLSKWNTAAGWGDHSVAGYLKAESDPAFTASAAATVTAADIANWNTAASWGNHATAGYLTAESDPLFASSVAATISATDATNWNQAFGWGDHAAAGYLKSETDPKIGALTNGKLPKWNGAQLVDSVIAESATGNVGIGAAAGAAQLTVSTLAKFGTSFNTSTSKSCSMSGFDWTNSPPSGTACNAYCTTRGFTSGAVVPTGSKNCGGASCDYISDFETCSVAVMQNNGNCNSCASSFVCTCQTSGTEIDGSLRVVSGNVGIGVNHPNSPLQVSGYLQLGTTTGAPPAADCDAANERGRMMVDPGTGALWVCANSGWVSK